MIKSVDPCHYFVDFVVFECFSVNRHPIRRHKCQRVVNRRTIFNDVNDVTLGLPLQRTSLVFV